MELWYPSAEHIPFEHADGGSYLDGPFRGVLHTTESIRFHPSTLHYYGHKNPPHFTLDFDEEDGIARMYQHFKIDRAARALRNLSGGVQTNRHSAIQIEIAHGAARINKLQDAMWDTLAEWMRWVEAQTGIQPICPVFRDSADAYGSASQSRMSRADWQEFNGWCGHQHVPENKHWDPGPIKPEFVDRLGLTTI